MPSLSFEGETHDEIVAKVRRWLTSVEGHRDKPMTPSETVAATGELTKEALRIIAASAPEPIAQSDVVKRLTALGYKASDTTSKAVIDTLDTLSSVTGGGLLRKARDAQASALWEMNQAVAKQILKGLTGRKG